jgi:hydrophobe/amphiphile efflux-1 (HAE1) family protein
MSISSAFIHRPVGTTLLTIAIFLAGMSAYFFLPVSPLPQVEFPTIQVQSGLPGASPDTMASSVATPLERQFGRIAGITEMTSSSSLGSTNITLQFDLNRNIDAAARDVQAAINSARSQLPANLPSNPTYRKTNPADAPIMILSITSDIYDKARMYDSASSILAQKLSQVEGVGQVTIGGGALPAVRVDVNPTLLNSVGLSLEDVRTVLGSANANRPKGELGDENKSRFLATTDQLLKAKDYQPLIIHYRHGAAVRLSDVATVTDSVEDIHNNGLANGKPAVLLILYRQPGANIIDTVDRVTRMMPQLSASIPPAMKLGVVLDRTTTIRASVHDVEITLGISISLVILVVFLFLRNWRATLIPSVAVPLSLIGTFGVMYLCGYSLDNLSLMALTICTGFVVDDAIVVIENITRYLEQGMPPMQAALRGAREIGFTVISISASLIAVFIPILLMGGIVGRLFREFAVVLSVAIAVSLVISLTTTPMMCAYLLRPHKVEDEGWMYRMAGKVDDFVLAFYERTLGWVLRWPLPVLLVTLATIGFTIYLYVIVPKGFFPQQDTGRLMGSIRADQDTSSQQLAKLVNQFSTIVLENENVTGAIAFSSGNNNARMFVTLKPVGERKLTAEQVMGELRPKISKVPGAALNFSSVQDLRFTAHSSPSQYQFNLQGDDVKELYAWAPKMLAKLRTMDNEGIVDVDSDQQNKGLEASLVIDRNTASRLGITPQMIDNTLYDAFGQRQVSTMYTQLNQYHVVMEASPQFWQNPDGLKYIYVKSNGGQMVPLSAFTHYAPPTTPLAVNHYGQFPCITLSFNLKPGVALGDAVEKIIQAEREIGLPTSVHGTFTGNAQIFQESLKNEPLLIAAALIAVYIVLGVLYESLIHPITILSTLPSAGVGALLAIMATSHFSNAALRTDLNVISLIGIILLIGIVKKNAIMMIDFALEAERKNGAKPKDAIFQACLLRFRPITMTTMAALLGGLPLALGTGTGAELRRPLGIAIVGGLIFSQMLTLYTTPVIYLYLDRLRLFFARLRGVEMRPIPNIIQG